MSRRPLWILTYEGSDISDEIAPFARAVTYTDHVHGKSDELELSLEDTDRRWRELWYPSEGDRITLAMGCWGEPLLPCGAFKVDEVELGHKARTATIRGLAVPMDGGLRTRESVAYESVTLAEIVEAVAKRYGLTVLTDGIEEIRFARITQANETSLAFLRRLAEMYGYAFSVRDKQLCFFRLLSLEAAAPVVELTESDLMSGTSFKGSAQQTYVACEVTYLDPITGKNVTARVEADGIRRGTTLPEPVEGIGGAAVAPDVVLRRSSPFHEEVRDWQRFLQGKNMYAGENDGLFGPITERGTRQFQSAAGVGVDGVVGPITYAAAIDQGFLSNTASAGGVSASGDVLYRQIHVESAAEAEVQARALLHQANRLRVTGNLIIEGNQRCVAGNTVNLSRAGRLSGGYMVDKSTHSIRRGAGYRTQLEVAHV